MSIQSYVETIVISYFRPTIQALINFDFTTDNSIFEILEIDNSDDIAIPAFNYFGICKPEPSSYNRERLMDQLFQLIEYSFSNISMSVNIDVLNIDQDRLICLSNSEPQFNAIANPELREILDKAIEKTGFSNNYVESKDVFDYLREHHEELTRDYYSKIIIPLTPIERGFVIKNICSFIEINSTDYVQFKLTDCSELFGV